MSEYTDPNAGESWRAPRQSELAAGPDSPEEGEIRKQLAERIVNESVGTVGISTSADFQPEQKTGIIAAIKQRREAIGIPGDQGGFEQRLTSNYGGWGQYGDVSTNPIALRHPESYEQVKDLDEAIVFAPSEDGSRTDVMFRFSPGIGGGYSDATNRPNRFTMTFNLPNGTAEAMREAISNAPDYVNDLLDAQAASLGLTTEDKSGMDYWTSVLRPRNGKVAERDREIVVVDEKSGVMETLTYGENKSIAPPAALEQAMPAPEAPDPAAIAEIDSRVRQEIKSKADIYVEDEDIVTALDMLASDCVYRQVNLGTEKSQQYDVDRNMAADEHYLELLDELCPDAEDKKALIVKLLSESRIVDPQRPISFRQATDEMYDVRENNPGEIQAYQMRLITQALAEQGSEITEEEFRRLQHEADLLGG